MMRSQEQAHAMRVIDAVVRGGGEARPEDAALVDFAVMIRAARPEPTEVEATSIDRRVEEKRAKRDPHTYTRTTLKVFGGTAASLAVVALAVAIVGGPGSLGTGGDDVATSAGSAEVAKDEGVAPAGGREDLNELLSNPPAGVNAQAMTEAKAPATVSPQSMQDTAAAPGRARKETRDAQITLAAPRDRILGVSDGVIAVVDRHAGYVQRSSISSGDSSGGGEFSLMIPTGEYQATLAEISKLAHVRGRTENTQDITGAYNQQRGRLARAVASRNRIAKKLAAATEPRQQAVFRALLRGADREVARQRARSRAVKQRVEYVQMNVQLVADESAAITNESTVGRAMDRAGKILSGTVAIAIVAAAVLLPILLIALAITLGNRTLRRRRSDGALDAAAAASQPE